MGQTEPTFTTTSNESFNNNDDIEHKSCSEDEEPPIPSPIHNALSADKVKWHYVHKHSTTKTNKARTPTANLKMSRHRVMSQSKSEPQMTMSPLAENSPYMVEFNYDDDIDIDDDDDEFDEDEEELSPKCSPTNTLSSPTTRRIDRMEKIFFKDLLNFRYGFYCFSEYLFYNGELNNLAFIVELWQFKNSLLTEMTNRQCGKRKLPKKKYEFVSEIDFKFLPKGDCFYKNQHNIVFQAWSIFLKYIRDIATQENIDNNHKKMRKKEKLKNIISSPSNGIPFRNECEYLKLSDQFDICIDKQIAFKIGQTLESIYQHYQFLHSQKKYYLKYQKNTKNISRKYSELTKNIEKYETTHKHRRRFKKCYFNRYVSVGSFGSAVELYGDNNNNNNNHNTFIPDANINTINETIDEILQKTTSVEIKNNDNDNDSEESISTRSGSVVIHNIEIIDTNQTKNGYHSVPQKTPAIDYEDDDDDESYDDEDYYNTEYDALDLPQEFEVAPLKFDDDDKQSDEEELDSKEINRTLFKQSGTTYDNNNDEKDKNDLMNNRPKLQLNQSSVYDTKDIWSVIEESEDAKISVEESTLNILNEVFDLAEYVIWDKLLEFYQEFKLHSEQYLICRYKLRSSTKNYLRQKSHQKIYTPRNRTSPFWKTKNQKKRKLNHDPFDYDYTNISNNKNKRDKIQIVDATEM